MLQMMNLLIIHRHLEQYTCEAIVWYVMELSYPEVKIPLVDCYTYYTNVTPALKRVITRFFETLRFRTCQVVSQLSLFIGQMTTGQHVQVQK